MTKQILTLAAGCLLAASSVSCQKPQNEPSAEFSQTIYTMYSNTPMEVTVNLDKAAEQDLTIPLKFSGESVKGTDYSVSSESVTIAGGQNSGKITITDIAMDKNKQILIEIKAGSGYKTGTNYRAIVNIDAAEQLVYSFSTASTDLYEKVTATLTVSGVVSGAKFKAAEKISVPAKITGEGSELLTLSSTNFEIEKGSNTASLEISISEESMAQLSSDSKVVLDVDRSSDARFVPGEVNTMKIKLHSSLQVPARLVGTWKFKEIFDQETQELFAMEDGYDTSLFPFKNDGFTMTFTENEETGEVTMTPSATGNFAWFYRPCTVTMTSPVNVTAGGTVLGKYTAKETNMYLTEEEVYTYYALSKANRSFDAVKETIGTSVIAVCLKDKGEFHIMIKDYDLPPFFDQEGAIPWFKGAFDSDMYGFASSFTKAE